MKAVILLSAGWQPLAAKLLRRKDWVNRVSLKVTFLIPQTLPKTSGGIRNSFKNHWYLPRATGVGFVSHYGFGAGLNPCRDCHALMLKKAREIMKEEGASFLVTGEVLGQRPFSQSLAALKLIEKEAGVEGLVLRPLSAKLLPPSWPEKKGLILKNKLYSIKGKQRKEQLRLSKIWGLKNYQTPAGGCLLTDSNFSQRLKNLLTVNPRPTASDLAL